MYQPQRAIRSQAIDGRWLSSSQAHRDTRKGRENQSEISRYILTVISIFTAGRWITLILKQTQEISSTERSDMDVFKTTVLESCSFISVCCEAMTLIGYA